MTVLLFRKMRSRRTDGKADRSQQGGLRDLERKSHRLKGYRREIHSVADVSSNLPIGKDGRRPIIIVKARRLPAEAEVPQKMAVKLALANSRTRSNVQSRAASPAEQHLKAGQGPLTTHREKEGFGILGRRKSSSGAVSLRKDSTYPPHDESVLDSKRTSGTSWCGSTGTT